MTTEHPTIRRVPPGDVAGFRALIALFARAFEDPQTYAAQPPSAGYLAGLLEKPHVIAMVATLGDQVVGGLVAYELDKFEQERREIYIYDLAVDAGFRRRGIATALISGLRDIARDRQAWVIFVQADQGDDPAIALYASLGAREEVLHFDIPPARG